MLVELLQSCETAVAMACGRPLKRNLLCDFFVLSSMQIGHVWLIRYCQPCYEIAEVPPVHKNEFKMSSAFLRERLNAFFTVVVKFKIEKSL